MRNTYLAGFVAMLLVGYAHAGDLDYRNDDYWRANSNNQRDFVEFLGKYNAFREKRDLQNQGRHNASFKGIFNFREECGPMGDGCLCPPGNTYLQCLESAMAVINVDPSDVGGRGYVRITVGSLTLNPNGRWVDITNGNVYSYVIDPLSGRHVINIPVPSTAEIASFCKANGDNPVEVTVGYGAAAPMEIEFARRMKERSAEFGHNYDDQRFVFMQARTNGMRQKKGDVIGTLRCFRQTLSISTM